MSEFKDHILDLMDLPAVDWQRTYFHQYKSALPQIVKAKDKLGAICDVITAVHKKDIDAYRARALSPRVYSYLLFLAKLFQLSCEAESSSTQCVLHMYGHLVEASMSEEEVQGFREAMTTDIRARVTNSKLSADVRQSFSEMLEKGDIYTQPDLSDLPQYLLKDLFKFRTINVVRELLRFVYFAYREHLKQLVEESNTFEMWQENLTNIAPYLVLRHLTPILDSQHRVSPLYEALFTKEECDEFVEEEKMVSEVFANVFAVICGDMKEEIAKQKREIRRLAEDQGRLKARQEAVIRHRTRLWIPTYVYAEIADGL